MRHLVTKADLVNVPIGEIVIGQRRREKLGKLKALAASIAEHGLIHPILLRGTTLVAGHRRLEACRSLNWKTIPARQVERLSDDELRAIELDENTARENLSDYATSQARLAQIRHAEADLKAEAEAEHVSGPTRTKNSPSKRGRPEGRPKGKAAGSQRDVAEATGISKTEQQRVERHVALGERYPFLQRAGWLRHHVLDAGDLLNQLPEPDKTPVAALLDQPGIPPEKALPFLAHAVEMEPSTRARVIALAGDGDEFKRRQALSLLARLPPPADPALGPLSEMVDRGKNAAKLCRSPAFKARIVAVVEQVVDLHRQFSLADKKARNGEQAVC